MTILTGPFDPLPNSGVPRVLAGDPLPTTDSGRLDALGRMLASGKIAIRYGPYPALQTADIRKLIDELEKLP